MIRLHNTLTGELRPLVPKRADRIGIYCCGPTVYDVAHIGHARAALAPDVLVRTLRWLGQTVHYVRNLTDVDDKILARSKEANEPPMDLSARMAQLYQADMRAMGCVAPDVEPKVSEHIGEIVALVAKLIAQDAAYAVTTSEGVQDVYFAVRKFEGYGKLSNRKVADLRVGARVESSDIKRDPLDFALWKGCSAAEWGWDSPWGRGRPGWHIECSAMSEKHLGHGFDVHAGGMDLIFPHHENEIAQSEAAHPGCGDFVGCWIHNGFVNIDKEKMSKSLGNFVTVRDVYERNDPEALRFFLLGVHYRGPIAFDTEKLVEEGPSKGRVIFPGIQEAERRVDYLYGAIARVSELQPPAPLAGEQVATPGKLPKELEPMAKLVAGAHDRMVQALSDDLNSPVGLALVGELAKCANELADLAVKRKKDAALQAAIPGLAQKVAAALVDVCAPLGLLQTSQEKYLVRTREQRLRLQGIGADQVEQWVRERSEARAAKDFTKSDQVRDRLLAHGIEVRDGNEGSSWSISAFP